MNNDDDLYGGYNDEEKIYDGSGGGPAEYGGDGSGFGEDGIPPSMMTSGGIPPSARPGSGMRGAPPPGTAMRPMSGMRGVPTGSIPPATAAAGEEARPMTAVKAAGYSSNPQSARPGFDPLNQGSKGAPVTLQKRADASAEEACRDMERKVNEMLEDSAIAAEKSDFGRALESAKEAGKKERLLCKQREQNGLQDQINVDLTYAVAFNLAHMYHMSKMYSEAINAYSTIVKNKQFAQSGRLRVNMGNIYYEQRKYPNAIKMYRMALDQIPNTAKEVRYKIMRNIGNSFVRLGQYQDAMSSFEMVMENVPDFQTGFNLLVCYVALGDKEKMKRAFTKMLQVPGYDVGVDEDADAGDQMMMDDGLKEELRKRLNSATRMISTAARLIAPKIDPNGFVAGFDWCVGQLSHAGYNTIANDMEMAKALTYLDLKQFQEAVATLKEFEKKEDDLKAKAATNLSFLYFLEGDIKQAEHYSTMAVANNKYNANALVNRGNCLYARGDFEGAKIAYLEAVGVEADCVEGLYNLGLVNKKIGDLDSAFKFFRKLNQMLPDNLEIMYQVGAVYDAMGSYKQAIKWLEILNSRVPHDPGVLSRLGAIHAKFDDDAKALHYYQESHRVYPVNMDVISWLGAFHVKSEVYEKATPYFDLASRIQPSEVKWQLMVASCYRRIGSYPMALAKYKDINKHHPDNIECLRYLVHICTDLNRTKEVQEYVVKLRKAERAAAQAAEASAANQAGMTPTYDEPPRNKTPVDEEPAFRAPARKGAGGAMKVKAKEDDEWGNDELGDDLLPM